MPSTSKSTTIPLVCILCPASKRFSDLSHLLTHLNSKGHLQSKHKLELRVAIDHSAQDTLDSFAAWYSDNNFAELLSERLNPKPKKAGGRTTKNKRTFAQHNENEANANTEQIASAQETYRAPMPQMQNAVNSGILDEVSSYETPRPSRRRIPGFEKPNETPVDPALEQSTKSLSVDSSSNGKNNGGPLVLKGEKFDGMDVFDAATPRTRRRRNQRKEPQVLEQMMRSSIGVEPAEMSYHPSGEFRASRHIYGPPSEDGSPVSKKTPTPRKKPRRGALQDKPVNIPRPKTARSQKPFAHGNSFKPEMSPGGREHSSFAFLEHTNLFNHFASNQTVNPFKLTSQSGLKAEDSHDFVQDLRQIPESPIYDTQRSRFESSIGKITQYHEQKTTHNPLQHDHIKHRHGFFENPLQLGPPRIALSAHHHYKGSKEVESTLHDPVPASRHLMALRNTLPNFPEDGVVCETKARDGPSANAPRKDPMIGRFKDIMDDAEFSHHSRQSTDTITNMTNPVKLGVIHHRNGDANRAPLNDAEKQSNSPPMAGSSLAPRTPPNPRRSLRSADKHRTSLMYSVIEEEDTLATPKMSLPQPPSSALRSTLRPARPSSRLGNYFKQPQYGFDPNSDPFDVEGNTFAL